DQLLTYSMSAASQPRSILRRLLLIVVALVELSSADAVWAQERQRQVLILYSTRRDAQIVAVTERELPRILDAELKEGVDYYSEYIDRARFPDPEYQTAVRDFLRLKYQGQRFDVVIAMQDEAFQFVSENRTDLFPESPVVFFSSSLSAPRIPNSTGLMVPMKLGDTVVLAEALQPDIKNVFVVSGADEGSRLYERLAREQLRSFEPRLTISYLTGLATRNLEARLAALPEHSIVYYLVVSQDGTGENFHPLEYLDRIAEGARAPIYSWVDSAMGHGIVGGSLKSQKAQAQAIGQLALRVLRGERADAIPTSSPDLNVREVDWRQLHRWRITA